MHNHNLFSVCLLLFHFDVVQVWRASFITWGINLLQSWRTFHQNKLSVLFIKKDDTGSLLKGVQNRKTSAGTIDSAHSWYELCIVHNMWWYITLRYINFRCVFEVTKKRWHSCSINWRDYELNFRHWIVWTRQVVEWSVRNFVLSEKAIEQEYLHLVSAPEYRPYGAVEPCV